MACYDECKYRQREVGWPRTYNWSWDGEAKTAAQMRQIDKDLYDELRNVVDEEFDNNQQPIWTTEECPDECPCDAFLVWQGRRREHTMVHVRGKARVEVTFKWRWARYAGYCDGGWTSFGPDMDQRQQQL